MPKKQTQFNIKTSLSPDLRFLIACCQSTQSEVDIAFILSHLSQSESSSSSPNPEPRTLNPLIALANQHGVLPLVYKTLKKQLKNQTIQDLTFNIEDWQAAYRQIAQRNMLMSAELIRIMELLEENNIQALAFKGPTLAQMAYGDITLRQYGDLDILVDERDLKSTGKLFKSYHYIPDEDLAFLENKVLLNISSDLGFRHDKNYTYIELHWKLFRKKLFITLDSLNLKSNQTVVKIQGKEIKTLQTNLLLVYLCAHGSKHMWERIEWIVDVDKLISNVGNIDWDTVWLYAKKMHSVNTLLLGLALCEELFHTKLPSNIQQKIKKHNTIHLLKLHTLQLMNSTLKNQNSKTSSMFKKFNYHAKLYDSYADKVKYYFSTIFKITPDDVFNINLPQYLSFLYFIIRPFRLAKKYLTK